MSGTSSATASRTLQFAVEKSIVSKVKRMEVLAFEQPASTSTLQHAIAENRAPLLGRTVECSYLKYVCCVCCSVIS